jgi:hypothetical protein
MEAWNTPMKHNKLIRWLLLAVLAVLMVLGIARLFFYRRGEAPQQEYLENLIGCVRPAGIEEAGLHDPEHDGLKPFRWTNGGARLIVPIGATWPQGLTVTLGLGVPGPVKLMIRANGQVLFDQAVASQRIWTRLFELAGVPRKKELTIEILSNAFVPAEMDRNNRDRRTLGVRLFGVFLHRELPDYLNMPLGVEPVAGIEEAGFYDPEEITGQRLRWTNGSARLSVPIRKTTPKTVLVELEIPTLAANRLAIIVNGRILIDGAVQPGNDWANTFSLPDVEPGEKLNVEVLSGSFVPAKVNRHSGDQRTLGVKVRGITLLQ